MGSEGASQFFEDRRPAAARGRDLDDARDRLTDWLTRRGGREVSISGLAYPLGAGVSNETIFFRVLDQRSGVAEELVLRLHPGARQLFLDPKFELQFRLLEHLGREGAVRVPRVRYLETDRGVLGEAFFVMDRMAGRVPVSMPVYNLSGWLFDSSVAQRRRLWDNAMSQLIHINRVPAESIAFVDPAASGSTGFDALWHQSNAYYEWASGAEPVPILERARAWLGANLPAARPTGLSWGDARIGNVMFDRDYDVVGVMDWEQVSLGGGIQDLGWWLFFDALYSDSLGVKRLDGLGTREETISMWSDGTGLSAADVGWYEVFAGFKAAIIYVRLMRLGKEPKPLDNRSSNFLSRHLSHVMGIDEPEDQLFLTTISGA